MVGEEIGGGGIRTRYIDFSGGSSPSGVFTSAVYAGVATPVGSDGIA